MSADSKYEAVRVSTFQTIPDDASSHEIVWDDFLNLGTQNDVTQSGTQIQFLTGGVYAIQGILLFMANASGSRAVNVGASWSGSLAVGNRLPACPDSTTNLDFGGVWRVDVGDYFQVSATQTSGGDLDALCICQIIRLTA